jgi:hypothetical protein
VSQEAKSGRAFDLSTHMLTVKGEFPLGQKKGNQLGFPTECLDLVKGEKMMLTVRSNPYRTKAEHSSPILVRWVNTRYALKICMLRSLSAPPRTTAASSLSNSESLDYAAVSPSIA